jgi:UDP-N-acetylmuramoyl-L-alanyl-D-glutamate--2,6-diaminopimelate ligase
MARAAEDGADHLVLTSDNPRNEDPQQIIESILIGLTRTAPTICLDRAQAISQTIAQASHRDVVLIAGKGHETYQEIGTTKLPFSDYQQVMLALKLRGMV